MYVWIFVEFSGLFGILHLLRVLLGTSIPNIGAKTLGILGILGFCGIVEACMEFTES